VGGLRLLIAAEYMRSNLFDSFAHTVEHLPAPAIIPTLRRMGRMLEEDLVFRRQVPFEEATSILSFCKFVKGIKSGNPAEHLEQLLPKSHFEFYRQTVERLVDAQELPSSVRREMDQQQERALKRAAARIEARAYNNAVTPY
jgi:hypothetical protein